MALKALLDQQVDAAASLTPTRIFYIQKESQFKQAHSSIYDFTSLLLSAYRSDSELTYGFLDTVQRVHRANPASQPAWKIGREQWYSDSSLTVVASTSEPQNTIVAKMHAPTMAMGTTKITFPASATADATQSPSQHEITLSPVTITTRAQGFVKESVPYIWAASTKTSDGSSTRKLDRGTFSLFRTPTPATSSGRVGKKIEIARYQSFSGKYELGGVLLVNEMDFGANVLVVVLTLVGLLGAKESFNRVSAK